MPMQTIRDLVASEFIQVNALIVESLRSKVTLVEDIGEYLVNAGGKRLRPLTVLLSANACAYQGKQHIDLAAIIEFLHTATLLHDDVVDMSQLRRGRPTANAQWGNSSSVLVGDFIYSRAFQLLANMGDLDIIKLLALTTNEIAEGEVLQLTKAGDVSTTDDIYMDVIRKKTAVLFAAAARGGAILAGADSKLEESLAQYGLNLGIAFQLIDDVLDYEGDPDEMGKNIGDDLAEGKPTLPLIYTMSHGTPAQSTLIRETIKNKDIAKLDAVCDAVTQSGALEHTTQLAQQFAQSAEQALQVLPDNPYKSGLIELANIATRRRK